MEPEAKERPRRGFCFTLNNPLPGDREVLFWWCTQQTQPKVIIAHEVGALGTPHLQGYVYFKHARLRSAVHDKLKQLLGGRDLYLTFARGDSKSNYRYCSKDGDFIANYFHRVPQPLKVLSHESLFVWQRQIVARYFVGEGLNDDRHILWVYDPAGNTGKTELARYLCFHHEAIIVGGRLSDALHTIAAWRLQHRDTDDYHQPPILLDVPRAQMAHVSYAAIEAAKNGIFCSTKYESASVLYNSPVVIVFANFAPDYNKLSMDRWIVFKIVEQRLELEYGEAEWMDEN